MKDGLWDATSIVYEIIPFGFKISFQGVSQEGKDTEGRMGERMGNQDLEMQEQGTKGQGHR